MQGSRRSVRGSHCPSQRGAHCLACGHHRVHGVGAACGAVPRAARGVGPGPAGAGFRGLWAQLEEPVVGAACRHARGACSGFPGAVGHRSTHHPLHLHGGAGRGARAPGGGCHQPPGLRWFSPRWFPGVGPLFPARIRPGQGALPGAGAASAAPVRGAFRGEPARGAHRRSAGSGPCNPLLVAGVTYGVKDFIAPMGEWRQALLDSPEPLGALFGRVLRGESISLGQIREALRVTEGMDEPAPAVRQWVELCDAIGVRD